MQQAIQKAIEGGYRNIEDNYEIDGEKLRLYRKKDNATTALLEYEYLLLDPLFWQALGKSLGWESGQHPHWSFTLLKEYDTHIEHGGISCKRLHPWEAQMHRFIDHLAEGKNINSFFKELLT